MPRLLLLHEVRNVQLRGPDGAHEVDVQNLISIILRLVF